MSEGFVFQKAPLAERPREIVVRRILWGVIILLVVLVAARLVFKFIISPGMRITEVVIENELLYSKEELFRIAGIEKNKYYFEHDLQEIEMRLEAIPRVSEAVVERQYPGVLHIVLYNSVPVALSLAGNEERSIPVAFNAEGEIIMVGGEVTMLDLPVISGLKFNSFEAGMKLPRQLLSCIKDIKLLKENYGELYNLISEIRIEPVGTLDYELVLYFIPYKTRVRLGRKLLGEQLGYALMVLDVLGRQDAERRVREIDFRTNEVVYKEEGVLN